MLRLSRILKNYNETGSLNEQINLYGFIGPHVFLTKSGEVGVILEVRGVDYECLDDASIDGFTKRLESALKLFDENYRLYQYLFKRNSPVIHHKLYGKPVVDAAIKSRIAYLAGKAETLFSLGIYYVVVFEGILHARNFPAMLSELPKHPKKALGELLGSISGQKQTMLLEREIENARAGLSAHLQALARRSGQLPRRHRMEKRRFRQDPPRHPDQAPSLPQHEALLFQPSQPQQYGAARYAARRFERIPGSGIRQGDRGDRIVRKLLWGV